MREPSLQELSKPRHGPKLGIIFHLITTRQEFDDSRIAADQLRHQKRQEIKLRAKAKIMGFELIPLQQVGVSSLEDEVDQKNLQDQLLPILADPATLIYTAVPNKNDSRPDPASSDYLYKCRHGTETGPNPDRDD